MKRIAKRIARFGVAVAKATVRKIKKFFKGVWDHAETIAVLTLAAFGLNMLLGELPFIFMLPMWIEATMVIPVLAVVIVSLLVKLAEWRHTRREAKHLAAA